MDLKREILTACQLLGLLFLLFWSLTWNLPANFDFFEPKKHLQCFPENDLKEIAQLHTRTLSSNEDKHSIIAESLGSIRKSEKRLPTLAYSMLPPFNIWKEVELTKQERKEVQDTVPTKAKLLRRKLNYSSSKCGAKILAANKEAKYRMAILNEKIDEYMLNPCKAKSWFIVELCDNIEATQIELANYELYSSTPKAFSVFWSDLYPTQTWQPLGTFEANDQRTVQTFELNTRNMGKFVKVTVLNHHGKEHFCPLSVFRILGYSMVYEYEDMELEHEKTKSETNDTDNTAKKKIEMSLSSGSGNSTQQENQITEGLRQNNWNSRSNSIHAKVCELRQKYCIFSKGKRQKRTYTHQPICLFLKILTSNKHGAYVCNNTCKRNLVTKSKDHSSTDQISLIGKENSRLGLRSETVNNTDTKKNEVNNTSRFVLSNLFRDKEDLVFLYSPNKIQFVNKDPIKSKPVEEESLKKVEDGTLDKTKSKSLLIGFNVDMRTMNRKHKLLQQNENSNQNPDMSDSKDRRGCGKDEKILMQEKDSSDNLESLLGSVEQEKSTESAALIQKESVLVKLTSRMKASETNLNLINRYLQKLSQSYRHQMEDMQTLFNVTLHAIRLSSEEANKIDEQQQLTIEHLKHQVKALNHKTEYLSHAQGNILNRVLELHAFFLILEFIIMSTVFSISVNRFRLNKH